MDTGLPPPPSYSVTTDLPGNAGGLNTNYSNSSNFKQFTNQLTTSDQQQQQTQQNSILQPILSYY